MYVQSFCSNCVHIFHWEGLWVFWVIWVILGRTFLEKTIAMFEISTLQSFLKKNFKLGSKLELLRSLGKNLKKKLLLYFKSILLNFRKRNISSKTKILLSLGLKVFYLGTSGPKFEKTIVIFEIKRLEFIKIHSE